MRDLDLDYEDPNDAVRAFWDVKDCDGRRLLYEHSHDEFVASKQKQSTVRDKAKQLLGTTSFVLALSLASVTLVRDWYVELPVPATIILLLLFLWVIAHFLRALNLSIRAITRDEVFGVPTQSMVKELAAGSDDYKSGYVYLRLAADLRSAATHTNQRYQKRVTQVILAQTSFLWGIRLLPLLFGVYVILMLVFGGDSEVNTAVRQLESDITQAKKREELARAESQSFRLRSAEFYGKTRATVEANARAIEVLNRDVIGALNTQVNAIRSSLMDVETNVQREFESNHVATSQLLERINVLASSLAELSDDLAELKRHNLGETNDSGNENKQIPEN